MKQDMPLVTGNSELRLAMLNPASLRGVFMQTVTDFFIWLIALVELLHTHDNHRVLTISFVTKCNLFKNDAYLRLPPSLIQYIVSLIAISRKFSSSKLNNNRCHCPSPDRNVRPFHSRLHSSGLHTAKYGAHEIRT
jgi:hypothetical protein